MRPLVGSHETPTYNVARVQVTIREIDSNLQPATCDLRPAYYYQFVKIFYDDVKSHLWSVFLRHSESTACTVLHKYQCSAKI